MSARKSIAEVLQGAALVLAALLVAGSLPAPTQALSAADALCRSHLYAGASKLARDSIVQLGKCHTRRLSGAISSATNCNDLANAVSPLLLARDAAGLAERARRRCADSGASSPAALGFAACPGPCDSDVPAINSYADVAECIGCLVNYEVAAFAVSTFGAPAVPAESRCFNRIARSVKTYLAARTREQRACQKAQDGENSVAGIDCRTADLSGRVEGAQQAVRRATFQCGDAQLAQLDSCGDNFLEMYTCLPAAVDLLANSLFNAVYEPSSFGTPIVAATPTGTPTRTRTNTPTVTLTRTITHTRTITATPTISATPTITATPRPLTCGNGVVDADEDCDDGGLCVGGSNAGTICDAEADCVGPGVCVGGTRNLHGCLGDGDCPGGRCSHCRSFGGDGCAANCTTESDVAFNFVTGVVAGSGDMIVPGSSGMVVFGPFLTVPLPVSGAMTLTVGEADPSTGEIPFVVRTTNLATLPIPISTIACACMRPTASMACGGQLFDENGIATDSCTSGFPNAAVCPPSRPCAPLYGAGNTAAGVVGCAGLAPSEINVVQDCNSIPGGEPFGQVVALSGAGGPGSALMTANLAIGTVVGGCSGSTPEYGVDGMFCTNDDPVSNRGAVLPFYFTTAAANGTVENPADFEDILGPFGTAGSPFVCVGGTMGDVTGVGFAGIRTACDEPTMSDTVAPFQLFAQ